MDNKNTNELIIGRNACAEALKSGRPIDTLMVVRGTGGSVLKLVAQCKEKGIVPIIATIPNVPERDHCYKNDFVRASGIRYVDFATAVGGEKKGSSWYEGMLSSDKVHPDPPGAKALFAKFISDFPEILI